MLYTDSPCRLPGLERAYSFFWQLLHEENQQTRSLHTDAGAHVPLTLCRHQCSKRHCCISCTGLLPNGWERSNFHMPSFARSQGLPQVLAHDITQILPRILVQQTGPCPCLERLGTRVQHLDRICELFATSCIPLCVRHAMPVLQQAQHCQSTLTGWEVASFSVIIWLKYCDYKHKRGVAVDLGGLARNISLTCTCCISTWMLHHISHSHAPKLVGEHSRRSGGCFQWIAVALEAAGARHQFVLGAQ